MQNSSLREKLTIVIAGHVDHGKSSIIGRLLADADLLPEGKLESVRKTCEKTSRPFEFAFLLDALKDEQSQGITIDSARCFFKTKKRDYIIVDAPGHVEFIKNMVTGASRSEAAFIVVDAKEGIQENSKRHGYLISMLGIKQVAIIINKMDLVDYSEKIFLEIKENYEIFLSKFHIKPKAFIPVSAREGVNITSASANTPWYSGISLLEQIDDFEKKETLVHLPFRFPVHDVYKFTRFNDDRRILAGNIETGVINVDDSVSFFPSGKKSKIKSIECFNRPKKEKAVAGEAIGFTLYDQLYIKPGEVMVKKEESPPKFNTIFKANMFWLGGVPMFPNKEYRLKQGTIKTPVKLLKVLNVLDAAELKIETDKQLMDKHDIAEVLLETTTPISFDLIDKIEATARFVIVDEYDIAGGGVILEEVNDMDLQDLTRKQEIPSSEKPFSRQKALLHTGKETHIMDTHTRSIIKAFSWRVIALITTFLIGWAITGHLKVGIILGLSDSFIKIFLYYSHERAWEKSSFGRKIHTLTGNKGDGI